MKRGGSPNRHKGKSTTFPSVYDVKAHTESFSSSGKAQLLMYKQQMQDFEDGLMGHDEGNNKSDAIERNTNLMVDVLRNKIKAMEDAVKTRIHLCVEDFNENSEESSNTAPKMLEAFEEAFLKGLKDIKAGSTTHKDRDNLVSTDGVYIDASHLVIRTRAQTETAKKLEAELEETFASSSVRDIKKMRGKASMGRTEKSKKMEQQRTEAKRALRNRTEKALQTNMENFLTRSVMDTDLYFRSPTLPPLDAPSRPTRKTSLKMAAANAKQKSDANDDDGDTKKGDDGEDLTMAPIFVSNDPIDTVEWPIPIKWPLKDPRSANPDNMDGEMDPALTLRFAVEKISIPSGDSLFKWLMRQTTIQQYYIYLFWLIKVKFFDKDTDPENERFLLHGLSREYQKIIELIGSHCTAGAEYEKDLIYHYLPYILANGVFFGFFFLCPGSRHIYTRGFKKTILLQVVKIMHGIQLCSASIRVLWAKLFPEDTHEGGDDENADEGPVGSTEAFPVQIALGNSEKYATLKQSRKTLNSAGDKGGTQGTGGFVVAGSQPMDDDQSQLTFGSATLGVTGGVNRGGGTKRIAGYGGVLAGEDMVATHVSGGPGKVTKASGRDRTHSNSPSRKATDKHHHSSSPSLDNKDHMKSASTLVYESLAELRHAAKAKAAESASRSQFGSEGLCLAAIDATAKHEWNTRSINLKKALGNVERTRPKISNSLTRKSLYLEEDEDISTPHNAKTQGFFKGPPLPGEKRQVQTKNSLNFKVSKSLPSLTTVLNQYTSKDFEGRLLFDNPVLPESALEEFENARINAELALGLSPRSKITPRPGLTPRPDHPVSGPTLAHLVQGQGVGLTPRGRPHNQWTGHGHTPPVSHTPPHHSHPHHHQITHHQVMASLAATEKGSPGVPPDHALHSGHVSFDDMGGGSQTGSKRSSAPPGPGSQQHSIAGHSTAGSTGGPGLVASPTESRSGTGSPSRTRKNNSIFSIAIEEVVGGGEDIPLERTLLTSTAPRPRMGGAPLRQPIGLRERINAKAKSPLIQEYFLSTIQAPPASKTVGCVMMTRTVPVNWCATGGSDTHHKRIVHKDLHEKISEDRKQAERDFRKASVDGRKKRYENIRGVELKCQAVLHSDAATIGRYSLDLVRRQQVQRKTRHGGGKDVGPSPMDDIGTDFQIGTVNDTFDEEEFENFLATI